VLSGAEETGQKGLAWQASIVVCGYCTHVKYIGRHSVQVGVWFSLQNTVCQKLRDLKAFQITFNIKCVYTVRRPTRIEIEACNATYPARLH
jgi:hypothetical protein